MKLDALIEGLAVRASGPDGEVVDLTCDSREVAPGWAFLALKGERADGAAFVPQALAQGAVAVLSQSTIVTPEAVAHCRLRGEPRQTMAELARRLHGEPDAHLTLIGVTGTNGKTTTTTLIRQVLRRAGLGCGLVGTVVNAAGDREEEAHRTTPESPSFYRWLARSAAAGDVAAAVEVSSHALCLGRIHGARFRLGVFTNLTQDHLDYHGSMADYFEAKHRLVAQSDRFLVNADDDWGRGLLEREGHVSFAVDRPACYRAHEVVLGPTGTSFTLHSAKGSWPVKSPLLGRFNVYNLLAALAACAEAGFDLDRLVPAVPFLTGAPGRLERVDCGQPFGVMVDYAHTPDALEKLLAEGRRLLSAGGRLHVLFGCGGDRDRTKRPLMAAAVAASADVLWHTSDNPRGEDPERILDDAAAGIPEILRQDASRYHRDADRRGSTRAALEACRPGDLLLLAGKGHEPYQEIQGVKYPYSDRAAVEAVLANSPQETP